MIAEELFKLIRGDVVEASKEITHIENEEYLTPKDVARILGWHYMTVYKKKDELGCYVRIKNRIFFPKSKFHQVLQSGRL